MIPCSFSTFSSSLSSPSLRAPPATQGLAVNIPPEIVSIVFTDSEYSDIHSLFVKIPLDVSQRFKALLMWLFVQPKSENPTQGLGRDHPTTCSSETSKSNSKFKIQTLPRALAAAKVAALPWWPMITAWGCHLDNFLGHLIATWSMIQVMSWS